MLTVETITDEQIYDLFEVCHSIPLGVKTTALGHHMTWHDDVQQHRYPTADERAAARAHCAEILNTRTKGR